MTGRPRLDGAVPLDPGSDQDIALAALTRRVAELEHRLDMMKIIVGLVLAAKVLLVALLLYMVFGSVGAFRPATRTTERVQRIGSPGPVTPA